MSKTPRPDSIHRRIERRQRILKVVRYLVFLPAILVGALSFVSMMIWPPVNDVETGVTREYPDLDPAVLAVHGDRVWSILLDISEDVPRFRLVESDRDTGRIELEARSRTRIFIDDVTITMRERTSNQTIVSIRSRSRVGKVDFGQNARNIQTILRELDTRLSE